MSKFPKYKLTEKQMKGIACIVACEQSGIEGMMAEASQIANRTDIKGDSYATPANIVKQVKSGWYAHGTDRYNRGTSDPLALKVVRLAICLGYRTLPRYVDEHDCMSDIDTVKNGKISVKGDKSKWVRHKTVINNRFTATYTFYSFPGGYKSKNDPFGYTKKANREKYGDFCYTIAEIEDILDNTPEAKAAVQKIIAVAEAEVGYLEKKSNKDLNSKTANAGKANFTKYGKWIGANGDYWCASFVSWLFKQAFGQALGKQLLCGSYSAACETIRQNFKKMYQLKTSPKPGDVIFFSGSRHSGANHIGLVYKVADGKVYTIEGNSSGASDVIDNGGGVVRKSYKATNSKILGYGHPDYSQYTLPAAEKPTENPSKPTQGTSYYPKCKNSFSSLVDALASIGVKDTSKAHRKKIAEKNGVKNYSGKATQNTKLLDLLKAGKLRKE